MQLFLQISISSNLTPVRPQLAEPSLSRPCIHNHTRSRSAHAPTTAHWKDLLLHHQWGCGLPLLDDALRLCQWLARFETNIDASSNLSLVAPIGSFDGARFVALAMGAVTVGRAISQPFSDNRFRCESRKACSTLKERLDIISFARFCARMRPAIFINENNSLQRRSNYD
jgi:hypothetical protein